MYFEDSANRLDVGCEKKNSTRRFLAWEGARMGEGPSAEMGGSRGSAHPPWPSQLLLGSQLSDRCQPSTIPLGILA